MSTSAPSAARTRPPTRLALVRSSINIDESFQVADIVRPGQTIRSTGYHAHVGGKGANVAAAIGLALQDEEHTADGAGGPSSSSASTTSAPPAPAPACAVRLLAAIGSDGLWTLDELRRRNVDVSAVLVHPDAPTGRALIQVSERGENSIVLIAGANHAACASESGAGPDPEREGGGAGGGGGGRIDDAVAVLERERPRVLVLHNEIPLRSTRSYLDAAAAAVAAGRPSKPITVFNPSPMLGRSDAQAFAWSSVDVLVLNEGEAASLAELLLPSSEGSKSDGRPPRPEHVVSVPCLQAVSWIIITRGPRGVTACVRPSRAGAESGSGPRGGPERSIIEQPAFQPAKVVDTTGAGDVFLGYLVAGLLLHQQELQDDGDGDGAHEEGLPSWPDAIRAILATAVCAAGISVEAPAAMESFPSRATVRRRQREDTRA